MKNFSLIHNKAIQASRGEKNQPNQIKAKKLKFYFRKKQKRTENLNIFEEDNPRYACQSANSPRHRNMLNDRL